MDIERSSDAAGRVASAAQRLRQAMDLPLPPDQRHERLRAELAADLDLFPAADRPAFLADILARLAAPTIPAPRAATEAPADAESLAARLIDAAKALPADRKQALLTRLSAELAAPADAAPADVGPFTAELRKTTGLADADTLDPTRIGELAALLAEFGGGLDELVWTAWRQVIAPQSRISRPGPLRRTFGQFLRGDPFITRQRVADDVKLLRLITAATIAATSRAGKNFARKHLIKFSPESIKASTGASGWGAHAKYWAKFEELAAVLSEENIEAEVMQTIGEAARGLAEGKEGPRPQA